MLYIPRHGFMAFEDNFPSTTGAELGTAVAAGVGAHTKNTTYTTLIASTSYDSWGIFVIPNFTAVASTRTSALIDIAIGASTAETVIIPNLIAGNAGQWGSASSFAHQYYFPIRIPAGTRISATAQTFAGSNNVYVGVALMQYPTPGQWYGSRVTAYGALTASSTGTSISPGNGSYVEGTLDAATANPIKYMQVGMDLYTDSTGGSARELLRITVGTTVLLEGLPANESTTAEQTNFVSANFMLSRMSFDIPSGIALKLAAMRNAAAEARGYAIYGVD